MVGYLKLDLARAHPAHHFSNRLADVMELFSKDDAKDFRHFSHCFCGIVRIELYPEGYTKTIQ